MSEQGGPGYTGLEITKDSPPRAVLWHNGVPYEVPPFEPADYGAAEAYLRERRRLPVQALEEQFQQLTTNQVLQEKLIDRAWQDIRGGGDSPDPIPHWKVRAWLDSDEGMQWSYWWTLRKKYPQLSREDVQRMFADVAVAEGYRRRVAAGRRLARQAEDEDKESRRAALEAAGVARDVASAATVAALGVGGQPGNGAAPAPRPLAARPAPEPEG